MNIIADFFMGMEKKAIFTIFLSFVLLFQVGTYGVPHAFASDKFLDKFAEQGNELYKEKQKLDEESLELQKKYEEIKKKEKELNYQMSQIKSESDDAIKNENTTLASELKTKFYDIRKELISLSNIEIELLKKIHDFEKRSRDLIKQINKFERTSKHILPSWFKQNVNWWRDGLISDADMINALESLMVQKIIPLERFVKITPSKTNQSYDRQEDVSIPDYQKIVFGFWSDGEISDSEIINAIGHLMSEGIINSKNIQDKINSINTVVPPDVHSLFTNDELIEIYRAIYVYDYISKVRLPALAAEIGKLDENRKQAWNTYSNTKNSNSMNTANTIEESYNKSKQDLEDLTKISKDIVSLGDKILEVGKSHGISSLVFEQSTKEQQEKIENINKSPKTQNEIDDATKEAKKAKLQGDKILMNIKNKNNLEASIVEKFSFFEGDPCDYRTTKLTFYWNVLSSGTGAMLLYVEQGPRGIKSSLALPFDSQSLTKDKAIGGTIKSPKPGTYTFDITKLFATEIIDGKSRGNEIDNLGQHRITAVVPECSYTSDYSHIPENAIVDEPVSDDLNVTPTFNDLISNSEIDSVVDDLEYVSDKLNELIEDDPLPGLDYDLSDEEIEKLNEGLFNVILVPEFEEENGSECKGVIQVSIYVSDEEISNLDEYYEFEVLVTENGPRGKITHTDIMVYGQSYVHIENPPSGKYAFSVEAIFDPRDKNDIFSGEYELTGLDETVIVPECTDESHLQIPEDPAPYVVPEPQLESTSYDYTLSVDYPAYRYFGDLDNCNFENDLHSVSWFLDISPSAYDVDSGVFVGKIMIEHYDGTTQYVDSPVYDEPNISWNTDAGPSGSTSYATLLDIVSPAGLSINYVSDPDTEKITMTTPQCSSDVELEEIRLVDSLEINGNYYPYMQFVVGESDACSSSHYHVSASHAVSKDLAVLNDPNPGGCGFGTVSQVSRTSAVYYVYEILAWEEMTGIDLPNVP